MGQPLFFKEEESISGQLSQTGKEKGRKNLASEGGQSTRGTS